MWLQRPCQAGESARSSGSGRRAAAVTSACPPPKPTSSDVSPSSTMPRPPGVIGREPSTRIADHAAKASIRFSGCRHVEHVVARRRHRGVDAEMACERREREHVPAAAQQADRLLRADERLARPDRRAAPDDARFTHETARAAGVAHRLRELGAPRADQSGDDGAEHYGTHQCHRLQQRVVAAFHRPVGRERRAGSRR